MCSPRPSASPRRGSAGFTLIELMVGVLIGLLSTLAVTHVLVNSEGQKRTTTNGSDAQINGGLALGVLQRTVQSAGYGFGAVPAVIGCPITATYAAAPAGLPANLVPLIIGDGGAAGAPDTIRILSSGKKSFSVPLRIVKDHAAAAKITSLASIRGVEEGDLLLAARDSVGACEMFRVTSFDSSTAEVSAEDANWNSGGGPAGAYSTGAFAINMGVPADITFSIHADTRSLRSKALHVDGTGKPAYDADPGVEMFSNIVNLQALYGKDSDGNGSVDLWDTVTPATNDDWRKVVALRVAIVSRSAQYEKEAVTFDDVDWDVGAAGTVTDTTGATVDCGPSKCLKLVVKNLPDWEHYRYRVFDTIIPLRNMLWNS